MAESEERKKWRPLSSELLDLLVPLDQDVLCESRRLGASKGVRVEDLALCVAQDPVLVIEFLRAANLICLSEGKPVLSSLTRAIDRLGSDSIIKLLDGLTDRKSFSNPDVSRWFEIHRGRCKRTSIVGKMFAETLVKQLSDDCQLSGLFLFFGDMLTVSHLERQYVELAEEYQRGALNYRLVQAFKFEPQEVGLDYLRKTGIPEHLLGAIDKEASLRGDRAILKTIVNAAGEMVDTFDSNRWEKLSPGATLPSKSAIRLLVLSKQQYLKIYERATEYLSEMRDSEERKKNPPVEEAPQMESNFISFAPQTNSLQGEIQNLLFGLMNEPEPEEDEGEALIRELEREFGLLDQQKKSARSSDSPRKIAPPPLQTKRGNEFLTNISSMFESVSSSEELLGELLERLTDEGLFEKAAIIALSNDTTSAIVVAARGLNVKHGQKMRIRDTLSPLARGFSKVQSFGNVSNENSPFGSKAFALAPLNANHRNPVALYADCGVNGSLTFEARRIFRTVVDMANQKLVQLPGGIPVEIDDHY